MEQDILEAMQMRVFAKQVLKLKEHLEEIDSSICLKVIEMTDFLDKPDTTT